MEQHFDKKPPVSFPILASEKDVLEVMDDLKKQGARINLEKIDANDLIYIATVWTCLNHLKKKTLSKFEIAELMIAYLGYDEIVPWLSSRSSQA